MERTNNFVRHHRDSIRFGYHCFDRIVCHGRIPAFWGLGNSVLFLRQRHDVCQITPNVLRQISTAHHQSVEQQAEQLGIPLVPAPKAGVNCPKGQKVRRHEWVRPYYEDLPVSARADLAAGKTATALILKARESSPVIASYSSRNYHLDRDFRQVNLHYFYLLDPDCGRMWVRICPYFPFNILAYVNGHEWIAQQLRREGIPFQQDDNAFIHCDQPERLQEIADAFQPRHISGAVERCLEQWLTYFSAEDRDQGLRHQLYLCQVEYCDNLIFQRQAALARLFERMLDDNRFLGRPDKLAIVFGRALFRPDTRTGNIEMNITRLRTPVLRCGFKMTSIKQYVKNNVLLRTEAASHQLRDLSLRKSIDNLPKVRAALQSANERCHNVQQDILSTFVDRGQLEQLRQPTISVSGRRTPGLRLDDPRLLALWQALTCFVHLVRNGVFRTRDLLPEVQRVLNRPDYRLSQLRYDLGKLRGKGLIQRLPHSNSYQITSAGFRLAVVYLKLYHRLLAPLSAAILAPAPGDNLLLNSRQKKLDRHYLRVTEALSRLSAFLGFAA
jgi:hypothetical protein